MWTPLNAPFKVSRLRVVFLAKDLRRQFRPCALSRRAQKLLEGGCSCPLLDDSLSRRPCASFEIEVGKSSLTNHVTTV
jgi:hypothetical protein